MEPTLRGERDGITPDHVIADRVSYLFSKPERGDLLVFSTSEIPEMRKFQGDEEIFFVMRLVGLPGERIEIRDGVVFADGVELGEDDGIPPISYVTLDHIPSVARKEGDAFVVEDGEYFVLGDNSPHSYDSRMWGGVPEASIFGKVTKIYFPFSRWGRPAFRAPGS